MQGKLVLDIVAGNKHVVVDVVNVNAKKLEAFIAAHPDSARVEVSADKLEDLFADDSQSQSAAGGQQAGINIDGGQ